MSSNVLLDSIQIEIGGDNEWPDDAKLFQPYETEQILMPDSANCLAVQAFLHMANLKYETVYKANAAEMSPTGRVPFIKVGQYLVAELEPIVSFAQNKNISLTTSLTDAEKSDMRAYISLINTVFGNAENYITWCDPETYSKVTKKRFSSIHPFPLNHILVWKQRSATIERMKALGGKTEQEAVLDDVDLCCQSLSDRLGDRDFFFNSGPTEVDCLLYAHVSTILNWPHFHVGNLLAQIIIKYPKLVCHGVTVKKKVKLHERDTFGIYGPLITTYSNICSCANREKVIPIDTALCHKCKDVITHEPGLKNEKLPTDLNESSSKSCAFGLDQGTSCLQNHPRVEFCKTEALEEFNSGKYDENLSDSKLKLDLRGNEKMERSVKIEDKNSVLIGSTSQEESKQLNSISKTGMTAHIDSLNLMGRHQLFDTCTSVMDVVNIGGVTSSTSKKNLSGPENDLKSSKTHVETVAQANESCESSEAFPPIEICTMTEKVDVKLHTNETNQKPCIRILGAPIQASTTDDVIIFADNFEGRETSNVKKTGSRKDFKSSSGKKPESVLSASYYNSESRKTKGESDSPSQKQAEVFEQKGRENNNREKQNLSTAEKSEAFPSSKPDEAAKNEVNLTKNESLKTSDSQGLSTSSSANDREPKIRTLQNCLSSTEKNDSATGISDESNLNESKSTSEASMILKEKLCLCVNDNRALSTQDLSKKDFFARNQKVEGEESNELKNPENCKGLECLQDKEEALNDEDKGQEKNEAQDVEMQETLINTISLANQKFSWKSLKKEDSQDSDCRVLSTTAESGGSERKSQIRVFGGEVKPDCCTAVKASQKTQIPVLVQKQSSKVKETSNLTSPNTSQSSKKEPSKSVKIDSTSHSKFNIKQDGLSNSRLSPSKNFKTGLFSSFLQLKSEKSSNVCPSSSGYEKESAFTEKERSKENLIQCESRDSKPCICRTRSGANVLPPDVQKVESFVKCDTKASQEGGKIEECTNEALKNPVAEDETLCVTRTISTDVSKLLTSDTCHEHGPSADVVKTASVDPSEMIKDPLFCKAKSSQNDIEEAKPSSKLNCSYDEKPCEKDLNPTCSEKDLIPSCSCSTRITVRKNVGERTNVTFSKDLETVCAKNKNATQSSTPIIPDFEKAGLLNDGPQPEGKYRSKEVIFDGKSLKRNISSQGGIFCERNTGSTSEKDVVSMNVCLSKVSGRQNLGERTNVIYSKDYSKECASENNKCEKSTTPVIPIFTNPLFKSLNDLLSCESKGKTSKVRCLFEPSAKLINTKDGKVCKKNLDLGRVENIVPTETSLSKISVAQSLDEITNTAALNPDVDSNEPCAAKTEELCPLAEPPKTDLKLISSQDPFVCEKSESLVCPQEKSVPNSTGSSTNVSIKQNLNESFNGALPISPKDESLKGTDSKAKSEFEKAQLTGRSSSGNVGVFGGNPEVCEGNSNQCERNLDGKTKAVLTACLDKALCMAKSESETLLCPERKSSKIVNVCEGNLDGKTDAILTDCQNINCLDEASCLAKLASETHLCPERESSKIVSVNEGNSSQYEKNLDGKTDAVLTDCLDKALCMAKSASEIHVCPERESSKIVSACEGNSNQCERNLDRKTEAALTDCQNMNCLDEASCLAKLVSEIHLCPKRESSKIVSVCEGNSNECERNLDRRTEAALTDCLDLNRLDEASCLAKSASETHLCPERESSKTVSVGEENFELGGVEDEQVISNLSVSENFSESTCCAVLNLLQKESLNEVLCEAKTESEVLPQPVLPPKQNSLEDNSVVISPKQNSTQDGKVCEEGKNLLCSEEDPLSVTSSKESVCSKLSKKIAASAECVAIESSNEKSCEAEMKPEVTANNKLLPNLMGSGGCSVSGRTSHSASLQVEPVFGLKSLSKTSVCQNSSESSNAANSFDAGGKFSDKCSSSICPLPRKPSSGTLKDFSHLETKSKLGEENPGTPPQSLENSGSDCVTEKNLKFLCPENETVPAIKQSSGTSTPQNLGENSEVASAVSVGTECLNEISSEAKPKSEVLPSMKTPQNLVSSENGSAHRIILNFPCFENKIAPVPKQTPERSPQNLSESTEVASAVSVGTECLNEEAEPNSEEVLPCMKPPSNLVSSENGSAHRIILNFPCFENKTAPATKRTPEISAPQNLSESTEVASAVSVDSDCLNKVSCVAKPESEDEPYTKPPENSVSSETGRFDERTSNSACSDNTEVPASNCSSKISVCQNSNEASLAPNIEDSVRQCTEGKEPSSGSSKVSLKLQSEGGQSAEPPQNPISSEDTCLPLKNMGCGRSEEESLLLSICSSKSLHQKLSASNSAASAKKDGEGYLNEVSSAVKEEPEVITDITDKITDCPLDLVSTGSEQPVPDLKCSPENHIKGQNSDKNSLASISVDFGKRCSDRNSISTNLCSQKSLGSTNDLTEKATLKSEEMCLNESIIKVTSSEDGSQCDISPTLVRSENLASTRSTEISTSQNLSESTEVAPTANVGTDLSSKISHEAKSEVKSDIKPTQNLVSSESGIDNSERNMPCSGNETVPAVNCPSKISVGQNLGQNSTLAASDATSGQCSEKCSVFGFPPPIKPFFGTSNNSLLCETKSNPELQDVEPSTEPDGLQAVSACERNADLSSLEEKPVVTDTSQKASSENSDVNSDVSSEERDPQSLDVNCSQVKLTKEEKDGNP